MKKSLCLVLSVLLIAVSLCSCSMIKDENALNEYTYVDAQGNTHEYATDTQGEVVTQENGVKETTSSTTKTGGSNTDPMMNITVYATDANGEAVTDKKGELVTSNWNMEELLDEMTKTTTTKKTKPGETTTTGSGLAGSLGTSTEDDLLGDGSKTEKTNLKATVVDPIIKGGKYTLKTTVVAQDAKMPMTWCFNGEEFAVSLSYQTIGARVFTEKGKTYLLIPMFAMYMEVESETSEDIQKPNSDLTGKLTYVKSTKVKDGKTTYTCEEYKTSDGKINKYYFNEKNEWKRWEVIDDKEITVFVIDSLSTSVDKSMFKIPKTFKKVDADKVL